MKSHQESADGRNTATLGLAIPIPFLLHFLFPSTPNTVSGLSEWVTPATPHAAGTNRGISLLTIAFFRAGATGRNGEEEVQEVSEPIWAR